MQQLQAGAVLRPQPTHFAAGADFGDAVMFAISTKSAQDKAKGGEERKEVIPNRLIEQCSVSHGIAKHLTAALKQ